MTKPVLDILKEEIGESLEDYKGFLDNIGDDKKAIQEYLRELINNSKSLTTILTKIKALVYYEFKEENIQLFMESAF